MLRSHAMTIGQLSRRTGVPIKVLRDYEERGFLCTLGRSESNYRLFDERTLCCVQMVQDLRSLGLTLKEIQAFTTRFQAQPDASISALLDTYLAQVVVRIETQIATLQSQRQRIQEFQRARLTGTASRSVAPTLAQVLTGNTGCGTEYAEPIAIDKERSRSS
jgi:MerR family copper efflux transcriptional regulator